MFCFGDSTAGQQAIRSSGARSHRGRQRDKGSLDTTADEERDATESKRQSNRPPARCYYLRTSHAGVDTTKQKAGKGGPTWAWRK